MPSLLYATISGHSFLQKRSPWDNKISLDSFFKVSKPYSERQKVCTPGEILDQVKAYFQDILLKVPVTIYEISLAYDSYFTDPEDGLIPCLNTI